MACPLLHGAAIMRYNSPYILLWPPYVVLGRPLRFAPMIYLLFFRALIFEAEERRPAGPLSGCRNVV